MKAAAATTVHRRRLNLNKHQLNNLSTLRWASTGKNGLAASDLNTKRINCIDMVDLTHAHGNGKISRQREEQSSCKIVTPKLPESLLHRRIFKSEPQYLQPQERFGN